MAAPVFHPRIEKWAAWSIAGMAVCWTIGFSILAGFLPPPSPTLSAPQVAELFDDHRMRIRLGIVFVMLSSPLYATWSVSVSTHLRRISPRFTTLADIQLAMGILLVVLLMMPAALFETAAFRPERSPESIQLLFDLSWFIFVFTISTGVVQALVIAVAIFMDRRKRPIFPRWAGYMNVWVAILFFGGALVPFFKTGPFAWNGVFAFWIPLVVFFAWMVTMVLLVQRAADRDEDEMVDALDAEMEERIRAVVRRELEDERARHGAGSPATGA